LKVTNERKRYIIKFLFLIIELIIDCIKKLLN